MGQKISPLGLRVGFHLKWASTWFGSINNKASNEKINYNSTLISLINQNQIFFSQGVISLRGGVYISNLEDFVENLLKRYFRTKFIKTRRLLPVDFRFYKGITGHAFGFFLYTKLAGIKLGRRLKIL